VQLALLIYLLVFFKMLGAMQSGNLHTRKIVEKIKEYIRSKKFTNLQSLAEIEVIR
jgi:hypothetical protein